MCISLSHNNKLSDLSSASFAKLSSSMQVSFSFTLTETNPIITAGQATHPPNPWFKSVILCASNPIIGRIFFRIIKGF